MTPALSTRVFGGLPGARELALTRQLYFLHLELWLDDLAGPAPERESRLFRSALQTAGLSVPCTHLPVASALDPVTALDLTALFGANTAIAHVATAEAASRLAEAAEEREISLAFETDTLPRSSVRELLALLASTDLERRGHGLCVDVSRTRLPLPEFEAIRRKVLWVEVGGGLGTHALPAEDDEPMRAAVRALSPRFVAYEVVPATPRGMRPGEAELALVLRRLNAWHRGGGGSGSRWPTPPLP